MNAPSSSAPQLTRRKVLRLGLATSAVAAPGLLIGGSARATSGHSHRAVRDLELAYGATVCLHAVNLRTGARLRHRDHERLPILSLFKTLAVAAVLRDRDAHGEFLAKRVRFGAVDVVENSPVTSENIDDGMTIRELCDAALRYSDNTAGNLLPREIGGPDGLTDFARSIGDRRTRLDRWEPELNSAFPRDRRDTTTAEAIAKSYRRLLLGSALAPADRCLLRGWMLDNQTSTEPFRAGLPQGWRLADKTGAGAYGTLNDVGVAWCPAGTPILIAALSRKHQAGSKAENALMAELAALAVDVVR